MLDGRSDEILFDRVRDGDMAAFDALYARYETRLFAYLRALLADRQDAEEIFHDAFLKALDAEDATFRAGGFRAWLYKVARNLALNRIRARERCEKKHANAEELGEPVQDVPLEEVLHAHEIAVALDTAVHRLPPSLFEVYHLRASGFSNEEIATLTDVPVGTVKSRFFQMVTVLRKELKPWIAP